MPDRDAISVAAIDWSAWKPVDIATLLFVRDDQRVLLIRKKRGLGQGLINAPGGRVDPGETPRQAAIREVQEELGITPVDPCWRGEHSFQFRDGYSMHVHVYSATQWHGQPVETDEAIPLWFAVDAIPYEQMWADDAHWMPLLLAGKRFAGRYIFDGQEMVDIDLRVLGDTDSDRG